MKILKKSPKADSASSSSGFTIVELLIATTVFSIVLIVFLATFLRISELFYKGVSLSNTQETARTVLQDITDDLQFSDQPPVFPCDPAKTPTCPKNAAAANADYFCI